MNTSAGDNNRLEERTPQGAKPRTTEQLPVYAAARTALSLLTKTIARAPRKTMRFCDKCLADAAEAMKCIALANLLGGEDRIYYLNVAEANVIAVRSYAGILRDLGAMTRSDAETFKRQLRGLTAQIAGWRASTIRRCHDSSET